MALVKEKAAMHLLAGDPGHGPRGSHEVLRRAVRALGKSRPTLAYLGCASGESAPFRLLISRSLEAAGCGRVVNVALGGRWPNLSAAKSCLDAADGVFVSGGDVERGMAVLERLDLSDYLRTLAEQGKPFIGISAGSIMLARSWIRWGDTGEDASAEVFPCLGLVPLYCDTHDEESGWVELHDLLRLLPAGSEGWGIPSGGDLVVSPGAAVTWMGPAPARFRRTRFGVLEILGSGRPDGNSQGAPDS